MPSKKEDHKESAIQKVQESVPDFLRPEIGGSQHGMEDVEQGDLLLPRLGLCQDLSPQKRKSDPSYIEGLQPGMLFNTVTQEIYGDELELILLFFFKNRIKFFPINEGGGIDCISTNGVDGGRISPQGCASCRFSQWGNGAVDDDHGNDAPECTLYHNYMSGVEGSPLAVSYKSTGLKASKQLLASIRITQLPMYAKKYKVTVVEMKDGQNVWFEKRIIPLGFLTQEEFLQHESLFNALKAIDFKVDTTGEQEGSTDFEPENRTPGHTDL